MTDLPILAIVPTVNPPACGVWLWAEDWSKVEHLDFYIHRWSMQQLLKRAEGA